MHPVLIWWGETPVIHTFGVLVLLGVIAGLFLIKRDANRIGLDGEDVVSLSIEVFLAGLVGSRIFFIVMNWERYGDAPWNVLNLREGGLVWYGGLLAALPVAIWRVRSWKLPPLRTCDVMATPVMLGLAIGRIGCLMAGDDHGKLWPEETWFTLTFNDPMALMGEEFKGKPLLPAQPLMSLGTFLIFCIMWSVRKKLAFAPGTISALLFLLYPIHRFLIEFTRGDKIRGEEIIAGLSTSQVVSLPIFPIALGLVIYFIRRGMQDPYVPPPPEEGEQAKEKEQPAPETAAKTEPSSPEAGAA